MEMRRRCTPLYIMTDWKGKIKKMPGERISPDGTPINVSVQSLAPGRARLTITLLNGEESQPFTRMDMPIDEVRDVAIALLAFYYEHKQELHKEK